MKINFRVLWPVDFSEEIIQTVIELGMKSGTWQESDRDYYRDQFLNPENINIICHNEDGVIVGYILAKPHNEAVQDYLEEDPAMVESETKMFYVDIVIVDKAASGKSLGLKLIIEMIKESNRRGVSRFSMHCRVINGLSRIIQHKFKKGLDFVRRIECYVDCNDEPSDYMEIVVNF
ncbi:MAG: GNAT family N-acetyltransferase [Candidatus Moraniibacteriota bacterium]